MKEIKNRIDKQLFDIYKSFFDDTPESFSMIDTSRNYGDVEDMRNNFIFVSDKNVKRVIKICSNSFTVPDRIRAWQRTTEEYINLGYYCPRIISDKNGGFPYVEFKGRRCVVYAEEYSRFLPLEERNAEQEECVKEPPDITYKKWLMTARVAAKHFDHTQYPSGYCLFEKFCDSDKSDEILEDANEWKAIADKLPERFKAQKERIWHTWLKNRAELEKVYRTLPTSVFQADLNTTNLLVDKDGRFVGVYDFNLCGREVFLNYLMRENHDEDFDKELQRIKNALSISSEVYTFSEEEREYALMLYRCLTPVRRAWKLSSLLDEGDDVKIQAFLDRTEQSLVKEIDFLDVRKTREQI